ncbi:hypothetical protein CK203_038673 [Vitis vinifera]|uniref:Uncharacterized protein n=1 Tax=Vitis vinifera TaxID=29760 RepID=A0A438HUQ3_VITVI|nr:hypothetical protein CK203_038673 [Vitis vinifera]
MTGTPFLYEESEPSDLKLQETLFFVRAPAGHESAETPIGHESNGAVAGEESPGPTLGKASDFQPWRCISLPLASLWEVINFVDYSLNQGAPAGHESAETPIGHESIIMRKELPPGMLLVDVVLHANLFPLQHRVQRRRCIRGVLRGQTPFFYFSLGCYAMFWRIWVFLRTLILSPAAIFERASLLTNEIRYGSISIPQNFPCQGKSLHRLYHLYLLRPFQLPQSPYQRQHHLMLHLLFLLPQSRPLLSLDQQTLILREIQQHLRLLPPAPPVAVPSTIPAKDPSYPPEEPTT